MLSARCIASIIVLPVAYHKPVLSVTWYCPVIWSYVIVILLYVVIFYAFNVKYL